MTIVDGGSIKNRVWTEIINKMVIRFQSCPNAYKLAWLHKGHHVIMTQQCLINFHFGGLDDNVLCDLIMMDSYRLMLGWPWKYHQNIIYSDQMNTVIVKRMVRYFDLFSWSKNQMAMEKKMGIGKSKCRCVQQNNSSRRKRSSNVSLRLFPKDQVLISQLKISL